MIAVRWTFRFLWLDLSSVVQNSTLALSANRQLVDRFTVCGSCSNIWEPNILATSKIFLPLLRETFFFLRDSWKWSAGRFFRAVKLCTLWVECVLFTQSTKTREEGLLHYVNEKRAAQLIMTEIIAVSILGISTLLFYWCYMESRNRVCQPTCARCVVIKIIVCHVICFFDCFKQRSFRKWKKRFLRQLLTVM